ncbi:uncharacterized protein LOC110857670 isoform X2 [Folsomia candida]|uniref:uncharacterized protein LOC110857670 isoform X2 n=1 Tax=Folsomia candida TaxID=158441 RepID=UPI001604CC9B|nr:uncharacterized protein LOC110857670 isoform X2 [Folsomia candida]
MFCRPLIPLFLILHVVHGQEFAEEYFQRFHATLNHGISGCHPGFKEPSSRVLGASVKCRDTTTASYLCFLICVYRNFEYIVPEKEDELDYAMADIVTMETFDMTQKEGRDSYTKISRARYQCGKDYLDTRHGNFSLTFDESEKCASSAQFFVCSIKSLTCDDEKYAVR